MTHGRKRLPRAILLRVVLYRMHAIIAAICFAAMCCFSVETRFGFVVVERNCAHERVFFGQRMMSDPRQQ